MTSFEEKGVFSTSRGERFGNKNSKVAVQVKDEFSSEVGGVFWTSRGERLVREYNFYHRGRDRGGGEYSEVNKEKDDISWVLAVEFISLFRK